MAWRHESLQLVRPVDHTAVLRLLADRRHDLIALRTRTVWRLHALLGLLTPGGFGQRMSADQTAKVLRGIRPTEAVATERKHMALELLADLRRLDQQITAVSDRTAHAVAASGTTVTEVYEVGPILAAVIVDHTRHVGRSPTAGHYARYNATAPTEASSGPKVRHRLNPRGNRHLNHALHMAAVTQIRNDTPGRAYLDRKITEGTTKKEAIRALKRRISDAVYRQLRADTRH